MHENAVKRHFCYVFAVNFEHVAYISRILKEFRTFNCLSVMKGIWTSCSIRTEIFENTKFCYIFMFIAAVLPSKRNCVFEDIL